MFLSTNIRHTLILFSTVYGMWWRSGQCTRLLYQWFEFLIFGKGKNQNIGRSPVNPAVNGYLVLLGFGKVKAVGQHAGHITLLCAEAAESWHALTVLGSMSLNDSERTFTLPRLPTRHFHNFNFSVNCWRVNFSRKNNVHWNIENVFI